ncbi:nrps [Epichloe festucae Fl1]|uniref:Nrps n=1 Tax=Epichloe festucae (strain Fl1) TaxID=877507 RepID=A0A7U3Q1I2_EPIFF|nr:nrps [Epichloe festucae Fl1]
MAPNPVSVYDLIRNHASDQPDSLAVSKNERSMTYGQLENASLCVAQILTDRGLGRGDVIPLLTSRCLEMVACSLAILRIGATLVPMESGTWSSDRIETVLSSLDYKALLVTTETEQLQPLTKAIYIHDMEKLLLEGNDGMDESAFHGASLINTDLAYIIFTSGTTGAPKGVMVSHESLLNYVWPAHADNAPFNLGAKPSDTSLLLFSVAFDAFYGVLFSTLCNGGHVLLSEPTTFIDDAKRCTLLPATPTLLGTMNDGAPYNNVRSIFIGGEAPTPELVRKWWTPRRRMWNAYGPTEATISITMAELRPDMPITLGKPIRNSRLVLLDSSLEESTEGELGIIGSGVLARGYYENPEQTNEKFIMWKDQRLYRTGDMAKWTQHGLVFLGRKDQMVKNRGFLINLEAEVLPALLSQENVKSATAMMYRQKLIAFVTPEQVDGENLRRALLQHIDQFLVPDEIHSRDQLPQTTNAKVDNKALHQELIQKDAHDDKSDVSPAQTKLDLFKSAIADALGIPTRLVRYELSFTDLGGNSLLAIKVLSLIRQRGLSLAMPSLFLLPTLSEVSNNLIELDDLDSEGDGVRRPEKSVAGEKHAPNATPEPLTNNRTLMTDVQKGMIRSTLNDPPAGYMLISIALHQSAVDVQAQSLSDAVRNVLQRHDIFSSSFDLVEGAVVKNQSYVHDWTVKTASALTMKDVLWEETEQLLERTKTSDASKELFMPVNAFKLVLGESEDSIVLWLVHHALVDGWSIGSILQDIRLHLFAGEDINVTRPRQFCDYSAALTSHLGISHASARCFWTQSMEGLLDGTELRVARPDSIQCDKEQFGNHRLSLGLSVAQVEAMAKSLGYSPAVVLHAAWALLLSRYACEEAVVFGGVFSARNLDVSSVDEIVGPLINTCPFPVRMQMSDSKADFLSNVQSLLFQIAKYQWSASQVLQEIASGSLSRIFSTALFLEYDLPVYKSPEQPALSVLSTWTYDRTDWPEFGLTMQVQDGEESLVFRAVYKRSQYESHIVSSLLDHFKNICLSLLSPISTTLAEVSSTMLDMKETLCLTRNSTSLFAPYSAHPTLKAAFEAGVDTSPHSIAIKSTLGELSYKEVENASNALARSIASMVRPREVVALLGDGSQNWLLGVLSIIKAGATYLPLDTKLPPQRMESMLETANAALCIYPNAECLDVFSCLPGRKFLLDELLDGGKASNDTADRLETITETDDYAYLMFTSGSTGTPKGIMVTHRATMSHLSFGPARLHARPGRLHAQIFSAGFDVNIAEIFGTLCYGATLVLKDPADPFAHLSQVHATMITPSFLSVLSPKDLQNLDTIYLIGEAVPQELADRWSAGRTLYNFYGPCECTIAVSYARLVPGKAVTLGKTVPRVGAYVLDHLSRPAPVGVIGEICLFGVQVMEGYIGKDAEEMTKKVFVQDPFRHGHRMYQTGDLGYWTESMDLRFVGRADDQVKVRGYRVELEEIERAIRRSSDIVAQAVAIVSENTIYAFFTPENATISDVYNLLRRELPNYAIPQSITALPSFPTTPNQKLDRKALMRSIESPHPTEAARFDEMELLISRVWREVLDLDEQFPLSTQDEFLSIGGNSLKQIAAAQKVYSKMGLRIPLGIFILNTRIESLAAAIQEHLKKNGQLDTGRISFAQFSKQSRPYDSKLSYLEEEFMRMHVQSSSKSAFNVAHKISFSGNISSSHLARALQIVLSRHDILNATYKNEDGLTRRIIGRKVFEVDWLHVSDPEANDDYVDRAFDLTESAVRVALTETPNRTELILVQHHIMTDQVSTQILLTEVGDIYRALISNAEVDSSDRPVVQYSDWASWRESQLQRALESDICKFWHAQLEHRGREFLNIIRSPDFSPGTARSVPRRLKRNGSDSSIEFYLAATAWALRSTLGFGDISFGVTFMDRLEPGTEQLLGVFLDALPVRVKMEESLSMQTMVPMVRSTLKSVLAHAVPSFHIRELVGEDLLFDVMIVCNRFEDRVIRNMELPGVSIEVQSMRAKGAKFPLLVEFHEGKDDVILEMEYSKHIFTDSVMAQFLEKLDISLS